LPKTGSFVAFPANHLHSYPAACQCKQKQLETEVYRPLQLHGSRFKKKTKRKWN